MKTKNVYALPVDKRCILRISGNESVAHVGNLKNSLDIFLKRPFETPIRPMMSGKVIDKQDGYEIFGDDKSFEKYGNFVEIRHKNGECSEYEHLRNGIPVKKGDNVTRKTIIGFSGATGWLAHLGPHLHIMVGKYGKTVEDYETLEIVFKK